MEMTDATVTVTETERGDPSAGEAHPLAEQPSRNRGHASVFTVALVIGIAVVSGAIGAAAFENMSPPPPRILVLDMAGLLDPIANDPALNAYDKRRLTEELGAALNLAMEAEAKKGAIILDASLVLRAPGESYVQP